MKKASILTWLIAATMETAHAETRCNTATKEQLCQRRAHGHETEDDHERALFTHETEDDHERALLTRKATLDAHTQGGASAKQVVKHVLFDGAPIVDVKVIASSSPHCGEGWKFVSDCGNRNCDLNEGAGGKDIWLCVKKGSYNDSPITDLLVAAFGSSQNGCGSSSWHRVAQEAGSNGDLNQGSGGKFIYLCYQKNPEKDPLDKLALTGSTCDDGMFTVQKNGPSNGDLNQDADGDGKKIFLCASRAQRKCEATETAGKWEWDQKLPTHTVIQYQWGSTKSSSSTKSEEWAESVSASVEAGFQYGVASGSVTVTGSLAKQAAQQDSDAWEKNEVETLTMTYAAEDAGKDIWQFQYQVTDGCDNHVTSKTKHIAVKEGGLESPPCCLPGYGTDHTYTKCTSQKARIPDQQNCGDDVRCVCKPDAGNVFVCNDGGTYQCSDNKQCFLQSTDIWVYDLRELGCE